MRSYFSLKKELNPDIQIPTVFVATAFPGAGPEDIEDLVTIPIEDAVNGLSDVTRVTSSSQESFSSIVIEFASTVDPEKAKDDVQNAVDKVMTLPEASQDPSVEVIDFQNQPVMLFALSAPGHESTLPAITDTLQDEIKALPAVEKVNLTYRRDPEISVVLSPEIARSHSLRIDEIARSIEGMRLRMLPGGTIADFGHDAVARPGKKRRFRRRAPESAYSRERESAYAWQHRSHRRDVKSPGPHPAFFSDHQHDPTRAIFLRGLSDRERRYP